MDGLCPATTYCAQRCGGKRPILIRTFPASSCASSDGRMVTGTKSPRRIPATSGNASGGFFQQHPSSFTRHGRWGVVNHVANARMLYLDVDRATSPKLPPLFAVARIIGVRPLWIEYRRSRRGWHVVICMRDRYSPAELVAMQALFGSDGRREALNLMRAIAIRRAGITSRFWGARFNILYRGKLAR